MSRSAMHALKQVGAALEWQPLRLQEQEKGDSVTAASARAWLHHQLSFKLDLRLSIHQSPYWAALRLLSTLVVV